MFDLCWTVPVARWSYWPVHAGSPPGLPFIEPLVRRRLSTLSKMALHVAHACVEGLDSARVVFASRHGELRRTGDILDSIAANEPVSPTAFSLSVLNAMTGVFSIARADQSPASAVSAGPETLGYALLEAYAQYRADPALPLLLVYADEPAGARYGHVDDEVSTGALAVLLDDGATMRLDCAVGPTLDAPQAATFLPTQSEAVLYGLCHAPLGESAQPGAVAAWRPHAGSRLRCWQWVAHGDARESMR